MKKLYLSITLLGMFILMFSITMIPLQASSYNDPVSGLNITLDTQLPNLNNKTLNQIFDYANVLNNIQFSDFQTTHEVAGDSFMTYSVEVLSGAASPSIYSIVINSGHTYYSRSLMRTENSVDELTTWIGGQMLKKLNPNVDEWYKVSGIVTASSNALEYWARTNTSGGVYFIKNPLVISLTTLGLTTVLESTLDYYYQLYYLLANELDPSIFYIQGQAFGYATGFNDGEVQGLLDGYDNGYNVGYNEGMDYAATNNITLLSVFQLIIGVVMSMLGFIINIELFGISIASVLGTLAIGIAIIWTLKLIRG